eukprot:m.69460 g.69460  ORF g.69460 m.69460 type:complete len:349 (-) comp14128_c0_seq1:1217-2263(-)
MTDQDTVPVSLDDTAAATPPPASPARTSGLIGKDYKAPSNDDQAAAPAEDGASASGDSTNEGDPAMTTGQKLASWWENKAKPGLAAFSSDSRRRMTVWKQSWNERAGKATKTIDLDLQPRFDLLRSLQSEYKTLCEVAKSMAKHVDSSAKTHEAIGTRLDSLSKVEDSNVQGLFQTQGQFMIVYSRNLMGLFEAITFFQTQMSKILSQLEATLKVVRGYESVRLEYDGYRVDYEKQKAADRNVEVAEAKFLDAYTKFQSSREDTMQCLKDFDSDKAKALKQQFTGLINAYAMFQSGNQTALDEALEAMKSAAEAASQPMVTTTTQESSPSTAAAAAAADEADTTAASS